MSDPVVFSASSINEFEKCPRRWYYTYIEQRPAPESVQQALGTAVHAAIEANMRYKLDTGVLLEREALEATFWDEFNEAWDRSDGWHEADAIAAGTDGIRLTLLHHETVAPGIDPLWIEEPVQFEINGVPYSGVIDLVDARGRIRDWKTTARKPRPAGYVTNMVGYAIAYRQRTGQIETEVVLDYLVRTKKAQYVPIASGGPISDAAIAKFATNVLAVAEMVGRGDFPSHGATTGQCRWCPYAAICPAAP